MEDDGEAQQAITNLYDSEVMGRKIIVNESQPKQQGGAGDAASKKALAAAAAVNPTRKVALTEAVAVVDMTWIINLSNRYIFVEILSAWTERIFLLRGTVLNSLTATFKGDQNRLPMARPKNCRREFTSATFPSPPQPPPAHPQFPGLWPRHTSNKVIAAVMSVNSPRLLPRQNGLRSSPMVWKWPTSATSKIKAIRNGLDGSRKTRPANLLWSMISENWSCKKRLRRPRH